MKNIRTQPSETMNDFYCDLNDGWYCKTDYPMAVLRAEHALRVPWLMENLSPTRKILDIGCGAGMLANTLAKNGHQVTGIDLSETSLHVARTHDDSQSVRYLNANAFSLPFNDVEFDVVCVMDILEHVEEPYLVIGEAARVLKPKGMLFFHTVNRTMLSYFLVMKGIDFPLGHTLEAPPPSPLFIRPEELYDMFETHKLSVQFVQGMRPSLTRSFWKMLLMRRMPQDLSFRFCHSLKMGYCGYARKRGSFSLH